MNNIKNEDDVPLSKVSADVPKEWLAIVDKFCKKSFIPRRKWIIDAMYEKLERDGLLDDK